ncbi:hypothetical protein [Actinoallomurus acanthiterrae]
MDYIHNTSIEVKQEIDALESELAKLGAPNESVAAAEHANKIELLKQQLSALTEESTAISKSVKDTRQRVDEFEERMKPWRDRFTSAKSVLDFLGSSKVQRAADEVAGAFFGVWDGADFRIKLQKFVIAARKDLGTD